MELTFVVLSTRVMHMDTVRVSEELAAFATLALDGRPMPVYTTRVELLHQAGGLLNALIQVTTAVT